MPKSRKSHPSLRPPCKALLLAGLLVCLAAPGPAQAASEDRRLGTLDIAARDQTEFVGQFGRAGSLIFFTSRRGPASELVVQLQVNGVVLDATMNIREQEVAWTGHGGALFRHDRDALVAFSRKLDVELAPQQRALRLHEDFLRRLVHLWAEAPVGLTLGDQRLKRPTEEPARFLERKSPGSPDLAFAASCYIPENNGITYFSCTFENKVVCHDADNGGHCFTCEFRPAGCGGSCLAECGPGCFGLNVVTWDCGDHDRCCQHHGGCLNPFDSNCGDEYVEAADDFLFGSANCPFCGGI